MKITADNDYRISIELSDKDLRELDITYEELDYSNIETRRVLWTVLDCARKSLGRSIDLSGKMLIEAQPLGGGGCVLGFTMLPESSKNAQSGKIIKRGRGAAVFEAENADNLLDALGVFGSFTDGEIFERDGVYRILPSGELSEEYAARLREFGEVRFSARELCAFTREHWNRIRRE